MEINVRCSEEGIRFRVVASRVRIEECAYLMEGIEKVLAVASSSDIVVFEYTPSFSSQFSESVVELIRSSLPCEVQFISYPAEFGVFASPNVLNPLVVVADASVSAVLPNSSTASFVVYDPVAQSLDVFYSSSLPTGKISHAEEQGILYAVRHTMSLSRYAVFYCDSLSSIEFINTKGIDSINHAILSDTEVKACDYLRNANFFQFSWVKGHHYTGSIASGLNELVDTVAFLAQRGVSFEHLRTAIEVECRNMGFPPLPISLHTF